MEKTFKIGGMHCAACSAGIEKFIGRMDGVSSAAVNLVTEKMNVSFDEAVTSVDDIIASVQKIGFTAEEYVPADSAGAERHADDERRAAEYRSMLRRMILCIIFAVPLLYISMGHMFPIPLPLPAFIDMDRSPSGFAVAQLILTIPILIGGRRFYSGGFKSLFSGHPNMDTLVALGTASAFLYSLYALVRIITGSGKYSHSLFFESSAIVITLVMVGKTLEARSKGKTGEAIKKLTELAPDTALVTRYGESAYIPASELRSGDIVTVLPGGRFPCDGQVTEGISSADVSMLTGESLPQTIEPGSEVTGGSINGEGKIVFMATHVGADTALSRIIRMVEDAQGKKAPIAKLADTVAGYFVPAVLAIAVIAAVIWTILGKDIEFVLNIFVSVLVIACPCSLGLATPTAIMVGTGKGAELGVLYKSGEALQSAASVRTIALDKTGTLTEGKPVLREQITLPGFSDSELLSVCSGAEQGSEHPVSKAIISAAERLGLLPAEASDTAAIPGRGISASVDGREVLIGNSKLMNERGIDISALSADAERLSSEGCMLMFAAVEGQAAGLFAAIDMVKSDSPAAVASLHRLGIKSVMLTGDNEKAAAAIASATGIDDYRANILPEDKAAAVASLSSDISSVAMVGDGINDAPALVSAGLGIAVGSGTDVAIESADIVLVGEGLGPLVSAVRLSRAVMRNIRQNLFWAFIYNCCGIPFAAGVVYALGGPLLSPMIAGGAMALSSVSVVTNALRLRRFKPEKLE